MEASADKKISEYDFMKIPQNTPLFMAGMNAVQG